MSASITRFRRIFVYMVICLSLFAFSCAPKPAERDVRSCMGTFCEIKIAGVPQETAKNLIDSAFEELSRIEALLSLYRDTSEISIINREASSHPVVVSGDTFYCLEESYKLSQRSMGAFDITVLPLLKVWGFSEGTLQHPNSQENEAARSCVGYYNMRLSQRDSTVFFLEDGMGVDLGGIAKGYGCDRAVETLRQGGCENALVNLGGTIYAFGCSPLGRPWRIGLRHPRNKEKVFYVVPLSDRAISTSGDYENFFIDDGTRYSHLIDPRTGYPSKKGIVSVSVIAPTALVADALSTAVFVMGLEEGMAFVETQSSVEAVIVTETADGELWAHFSKDLGSAPTKL